MKATRILLALAAFVVLATASGDYCSLVVEVVTPDGERPIALISVVEQNGRKLEQLRRGQDARFCDLGILPVTVKVGGDDTCNQVVVNGVPLSWQETHHMKITYDPKPCLEDTAHPLVPTCTYLFRVSDGAGKWIPGASIIWASGNFALKSDDSGRAIVDAKLGSVKATISAPGYLTQSIDRTCTAAKATEPQEELIKLSRK